MQPIPPSPSPPNPNVCILLTEGGGRVDGRGQCLWGKICTEKGEGRRGWRRLRKNPIYVLTHIAQKPKKAALFWAALFLSPKWACAERRKKEKLYWKGKESKAITAPSFPFLEGEEGNQLPFSGFFCTHTLTHTKVPLIPHSGNVGEGKKNQTQFVSREREGKK